MIVQVPVPKEGGSRLFTPAEVAAIFRVDPKTVTRWAAAEPPRIRSTRTPGGHRRFRESEVYELLNGRPAEPPQRLSRNPVKMLHLAERGCYG
jgi:excisionase family DNA binding protein